VQIRSEKPDDVKRYINTPCTAQNEASCIPVKSTTVTAESMDNDIFLDVSYSSAVLNGADYKTMINDLATSNSVTDETTKDHAAFRKYLIDNMEDIVRFRFRNLKNELGRIAGGWSQNDALQVLYDPIMRIYNMRESQLINLVTLIRASCFEAFRGYFDTSGGAINSADVHSTSVCITT
jgi:hypothetical protein